MSPRRPIRARRDNIGSLRVLSKPGVTVRAVERGDAAGRSEDIEKPGLPRDS